MRTPDPHPDKADAQAATLHQVTISFSRGRGSRHVALDAVTLHVPFGKTTCLLGPNGSGKTTLINVVTGLLTPDSGTVEVLGMSPRRNRRKIWEQIALVPQETAIYPELSARENLMFHGQYYGLPRSVMRERVDQALDLVQLTARADDRAGRFSGGMQRRLALGRALMMHPALLLLDEPTLGVDVQSREAIWERIRESARAGTAVLLTTNYMEEAERLGEEISIIDRGRNVTSGTLDDLTADVPPPSTVRPPRASLQEVFLHYTGRDLRD